MPRERRGIALSAARSELFNAALAQRVAAGSWNRALDGEVWAKACLLNGSEWAAEQKLEVVSTAP